MASATPILHLLTRSRGRSFFLPREHGAWGMLLLVAFGPLFVRGFAWFFESPRPLRVHRLGVSELLYAIVLGIFLVAGYHHQIG